MTRKLAALRRSRTVIWRAIMAAITPPRFPDVKNYRRKLEPEQVIPGQQPQNLTVQNSSGRTERTPLTRKS